MNQPAVTLLLDEHIWEGLAQALQAHGYDVVHVTKTPIKGASDPEVLQFAAQTGRTVLTFNHRDFVPLARLWYETGQQHAGIILSTQLSRGELLRRLRNL